MRVLIYVTLTYTAILVLALAVGLILIVYYLNGARSSLRKIAAGLKQVDTNVTPLESVLTQTNTALEGIRNNLQKANANLAALAPTPVGQD